MRSVPAQLVASLLLAGGACDGTIGAPSVGPGTDGGFLGGRPDAPPEVLAARTCTSEGGAAGVQRPVFVRNLDVGETGWFSSPAVVDLDGDGRKEIVAPFYSTFVYDARGARLARGTATSGRVYAPAVVADLDGDGTTEIVVGGKDGTVAAYEWKGGALAVKPGWPASTCSAGQCPETRGMAAADLDGDGRIEVAVTTTNTAVGGAQVFVFSADGKSYQPAGGAAPAWPRYNTGSDATWNGMGNQGYGCYGLNVGIGNLDDDPDLEIVVSYDNHKLNVFKKDGTSVLASSWYTNPVSEFLGDRMGWGQFIRWYDPAVEESHYHTHVGAWPDVDVTPWLQWSTSPPNVVDLDGDGDNEVVGVASADLHEVTETQGYAFVVLDGAQHGGDRAARRKAGWETPPLSGKPAPRAGDLYPPNGVPAPTTVDLDGDGRLEIVAPVNDGFIYAVGPDGRPRWRYDYGHGRAETFASEVAVADLNRDGIPELVFGTYSSAAGAGHLIVLSSAGALLHDVALPNQRTNPNGIGVPAAPTIADLDGDGQLEIVVTTFDHGVDVLTVPGSGTACVPWPTARGNYLRNGMGAR